MLEPIRILRVISRMNVGGPAWQSSVLTKSLNKEDFSTKLLCGDVENYEGDYLELQAPEISITKINSLGRSVNLYEDFKAFFKIRQEIKSFKPHIIHTHTTKAGVLGRLAGLSMKVPIRVHTFHGHLLEGYFSKPVENLIRVIESQIAKTTTALIAVGSKVRDDLLKAGIGVEAQYAVIPPGVVFKPSIEQEKAREILGIPKESPVIVFVGRLTKIKRPDRLLKMMEIVKEKLPNALLLIAGEGDLFLPVKEEAKNLDSSVIFLGWREDLENIFAAADLGVLSSDNEGTPLSLIESAAAGLPCVTTNVGSAGEIVIHNETGLVVDRSASALADAVLKLLENKTLLHSMGSEAKKHASSHFRVERLIADHISLYKKLILSTQASSSE